MKKRSSKRFKYNMGKFKQYKQKFRKEWLKDDLFQKWLIEIPTDSSRGHCNYCKCDINAKHSDLLKHLSSKKHQNYVPSATSNVGIKTDLVPYKCIKTSACEASISLFLSSHCTVQSCDHLVELCKSHFSESNVASKLKMQKTKCADIINNVITSHFQNDLIKDICYGKFSLLLDETNDVTVNKLLGIAVIYYSHSQGKIVSTFLSLVTIERCDSNAIVKAIKDVLIEKKLNINNLIGIGTDNSSIMAGINNEVFRKLKVDVPSLIWIKCICNSLQLAVSHATSLILPKNLEFLVAETYKWFLGSRTHQLSYKSLYQSLNDRKKTFKIPKNCQTKWLSIEPAVSRILDQWEELKIHFKQVKTNENCYVSEILHNMFKDEINHVYLLFIHPILFEIQTVNKRFESNTTDQTKLISDLTLLIQSVAGKITLQSHRKDPLVSNIEDFLDPNPYLGYKFEKRIEDLLLATKITEEQEKAVRFTCTNFLIELFKQLQLRLPEKLSILKDISLFSVDNTLKIIKNPINQLMKQMGQRKEFISKVENQFKKIYLVDWTNKTNTEKFWNEVYKYRETSGSNPFRELAEFAMSVLIIPHSNADIERIFRYLDVIKLKQINKMQLKTVNSLLCIKYGLRRNQKCCTDYVFPTEVLRKIGCLESYRKQCSESLAVPSTSRDHFWYTSDEDDDSENLRDLSDSE